VDGCGVDGLKDDMAGNVQPRAPEVYARGGSHGVDIVSMDKGASGRRHGDARPCRRPRRRSTTRRGRRSGGRRRQGAPVVGPDAMILVAELVEVEQPRQRNTVAEAAES
jgi:hypothetical protein